VYRPPIVQEFSLGTQTQITPSLVLEVGYSGARGLHLLDVRSINQANAAIHSYTTAFWWAAGIFAVGAIICGTLLRSGHPATTDPDAAPVIHAG